VIRDSFFSGSRRICSQPPRDSQASGRSRRRGHARPSRIHSAAEFRQRATSLVCSRERERERERLRDRGRITFRSSRAPCMLFQDSCSVRRSIDRFQCTVRSLVEMRRLHPAERTIVSARIRETRNGERRAQVRRTEARH